MTADEAKARKGVWVPRTPAGTVCRWLASKTEAQAWKKLLGDAAHMPYRGIEGLKKRGYTVDFWEDVQ